MKKILMIMLPAILLSSCGVNRTPYQNDPVATRVNLEQANYRIVKQVSGYSSATYILGIGGLSKRALQGNAVDDMYTNAKLTGNQQIINITTTQSQKLIIIYSKREVWAHGIVIEFIDKDETPINEPVAVEPEAPAMTAMAAPVQTETHATTPMAHSTDAIEADQYYIAYLMKSGHLSNQYRDEMKEKFDMDQIIKLIERFTTNDLNILGKDHDKALNKYYK